MKKITSLRVFTILLVISLGVVAGGIYSCTQTNATPEVAAVVVNKVFESTEQASVLRDAGFVKVESIVSNELLALKANYLKKYGLEYIDDARFEAFRVKSGLAMASASHYIGEIPTEKATAIGDALLKLKSDKVPQLVSLNNKTGALYTLKDNPEGTIFSLVIMVAPVESFDEVDFHWPGRGRVGNDPLALYRVENGWLVLAKW